MYVPGVIVNKKTTAGIALVASLMAIAGSAVAASALDKIKSSSTIRMGYREDANPFSFVGDDRQPRGYSIDLCKVVASDIARQLKLQKLDAH